jgi:hypothetical protein
LLVIQSQLHHEHPWSISQFLQEILHGRSSDKKMYFRVYKNK